jgi:hypothetical protein
MAIFHYMVVVCNFSDFFNSHEMEEGQSNMWTQWLAFEMSSLQCKSHYNCSRIDQVHISKI